MPNLTRLVKYKGENLNNQIPRKRYNTSMETPWRTVRGLLVEGYRVASGPSKDYPYGALDRQRPIFQERGLDLSGLFNGTLNIDIRPYEFKMLKPEFTFRNVE